MISLAGTGASLASEAVAVASLPAASVAVTMQTVRAGEERLARGGRGLPSRTVSAPAAAMRRAMLAHRLAERVHHRPVDRDAGLPTGTSKASFTVSGPLMRSGLTETSPISGGVVSMRTV